MFRAGISQCWVFLSSRTADLPWKTSKRHLLVLPAVQCVFVCSSALCQHLIKFHYNLNRFTHNCRAKKTSSSGYLWFHHFVFYKIEYNSEHCPPVHSYLSPTTKTFLGSCLFGSHGRCETQDHLFCSKSGQPLSFLSRLLLCRGHKILSVIYHRSVKQQNKQ